MPKKTDKLHMMELSSLQLSTKANYYLITEIVKKEVPKFPRGLKFKKKCLKLIFLLYGFLCDNFSNKSHMNKSPLQSHTPISRNFCYDKSIRLSHTSRKVEIVSVP